MTRRDRLLGLLQAAGNKGLTTAELLQAGIGSRYGARVKELRAAGYQIRSERIRDGQWRYTLSEPLSVPGEEDSLNAKATAESHPPGTESALFESDLPRKRARSALSGEWIEEDEAA